MTSKVKGQCRDVTWLLAHKSRMQSPRNTKIGRKVAYLTGNIAHMFQGQKVKVSRETESVSYLRSGKAYKLQNWYADRACYQLPRPAVKAYQVGFLHAGEGIPCWPNLAATQLVVVVVVVVVVIIIIIIIIMINWSSSSCKWCIEYANGGVENSILCSCSWPTTYSIVRYWSFIGH